MKHPPTERDPPAPVALPDNPREDFIATAAVVAAYFLFMLLVGFAPALLTRPVTHGGSVSIGLLLGVLVTVFLVLAARTYTRRRNRAVDAAAATIEPTNGRRLP
jgi:uncharacterized membrane protein (DUF485 family)